MPVSEDATVPYHELWLEPSPQSQIVMFQVGGAIAERSEDEGEDRVRAAYRDNFKRLAAVKARFDPDNLFRSNKNIRPAR